MIENYCRESGVRNLQKFIERIFRKVAYKVVRGEKKTLSISESVLPSFVGKPRYTSDRYYSSPPVGVVMGLAWTSMGGATLYVETSISKSGVRAGLQCTGQMGDVMKESTELAYTFAKIFFEDEANGNRFFETVSQETRWVKITGSHSHAHSRRSNA